MLTIFGSKFLVLLIRMLEIVAGLLYVIPFTFCNVKNHIGVVWFGHSIYLAMSIFLHVWLALFFIYSFQNFVLSILLTLLIMLSNKCHLM